jgi:hypothetical protein
MSVFQEVTEQKLNLKPFGKLSTFVNGSSFKLSPVKLIGFIIDSNLPNCIVTNSIRADNEAFLVLRFQS